MKKHIMQCLVTASIVVAGLIAPANVKAQETKKEEKQEQKRDDDIEHCKETRATFIKTDPMLKNLFENSAGYVIFPSIGKGAMGVGGATGNGILFEKGKADGKANMTQVTVGLQAGGKVYSEVIFFESQESLKNFKDSKFEFTGQVSAVAVKAGVSANMKYKEGVAVFTQEKGGLMYEASVGGQKFTYNAY
ncbi:MAG: lipid-binding SYLF domain-containing protein [Ferruginibacter sp.]